MIKIYFNLAMNAIKKNRVLYYPYIFASSLIGILIFIISSMSVDKYVKSIQGGSTVTEIFIIGKYVLLFFGLVFILYLSIFISRKRKKEYGVLSVLGMEKKHLVGLVFVENMILAVSGIVIAIVGGILLYKGFQSALLKTLNAPLDNSFHLAAMPFLWIIAFYVAGYLVAFIIQTISILVRKTLDVIKASSKGERKAVFDIILGVAGFVMLIVAYYRAMSLPTVLSLDQAEDYIATFASDVVLVIVATFLVAAAGSVLVLTILRSIKSFYYRKINFINISGLAFRMRRNGVGLGSVCILFTMVIVSVAGLISFFTSIDPKLITGISFNAEFRVQNNEMVFEYDEDDEVEHIIVEVADNHEKLNKLLKKADEMGIEYKLTPEITFNTTLVNCEDDIMTIRYPTDLDGEYIISYTVMAVSLDEYEAVSGNKLNLDSNQVGLVYSQGASVLGNEFNEDLQALPKIKKIVNFSGETRDVIVCSSDDKLVNDEEFDYSFLLVFPGTQSEICDYLMMTEVLFEKYNSVASDELTITFEEFAAFYLNPVKHVYIDFDANYYKQKEIFDSTFEKHYETYDGMEFEIEDDAYRYQAKGMVDFYDAYKGLIFVAGTVILVFIIMSIMVLYYKNVFDAYDDLNNFQIMRKVGLDEALVRKTVYSQMIVTTLLPIILASLHTFFAERFIKGLVSLFEVGEVDSFANVTLYVTIIAIVLYVVIGIITGQTYMKIINRKA